MARVKTEILSGNKAGVDRAATLLRSGALVAIPTETVYGLAGDARNPDAVAAIYAAKSRPSNNPLIVHVGDLAAAEEIAVLNSDGKALAQAFWPGPLTLVAPVRPEVGLASAITAGHPTVALRMPAHPLARAVLQNSGLAVAAPSANRSGKISPTTAEHVKAELEGRIAAILDGGPCPVGLESTIVGTEGEPVLLRPGGLPADQIEACLGKMLKTGPVPSATPNAPGQLASHYAPKAAVRLNATSATDQETLLGFGSVDGATLNLSPSGDLTEAASNLFAFLRQLDEQGCTTIAVSPIPEIGLGQAINDRLRRAAAPRP